MNRYIVELHYGCWLAPWNGDPGRTLVICHAQQFCCEMSASKALQKAKKQNPHRDFSDAKVIEIITKQMEGKMEIDLSLKNKELYDGCEIEVVGNRDMFRLLCKASSENEGWMKSAKACEVPSGCIVLVTTQQRNHDGSYAVAEALSFVPGVKIADDENGGRKLVGI